MTTFLLCPNLVFFGKFLILPMSYLYTNPLFQATVDPAQAVAVLVSSVLASSKVKGGDWGLQVLSGVRARSPHRKTGCGGLRYSFCCVIVYACLRSYTSIPGYSGLQYENGSNSHSDTGSQEISSGSQENSSGGAYGTPGSLTNSRYGYWTCDSSVLLLFRKLPTATPPNNQ